MANPSSRMQVTISSLVGLIVINCVMLGALFSIALAVLSLPLIWWRNKIGYVCSILVGLMCLISVGPHKFFLEQAAMQLAPVITLGSILTVVLIITSIMAWRGKM